MEIISLYPSDPDMISEKNIEGAIPFSTFNSESRRLRRLKAIVAMANDRAIGRKGTLLASSKTSPISRQRLLAIRL